VELCKLQLNETAMAETFRFGTNTGGSWHHRSVEKSEENTVNTIGINKDSKMDDTVKAFIDAAKANNVAELQSLISKGVNKDSVSGVCFPYGLVALCRIFRVWALRLVWAVISICFTRFSLCRDPLH
jgi:hypothetical protein